MTQMANTTINPDDPLRITTSDELETSRLGSRLAAVLSPGAVIALIGDLGAGKTRLVQAIAVGLGVPIECVTSPTFTLVQEYPGRIPLRHCDTYRLRNPDEFEDLGLDELLASDGIALIEWADRVMHYLPRDILRIEIQIVSPTAREFEISASGKSSRRVIADLRRLMDDTPSPAA